MFLLLYDLKNRLEACGMGSISFLQQDFKLKKAIDAFEPLCSVSPVLNRIYLESMALITNQTKTQTQDFLNLLGLINSVLNTQAHIITEAKELSTPTVLEFSHENIPHKQITSFYQSIYHTGNNRYTTLETFLQNESRLSDSRVLYGLIYALNDGYNDIKDLATETLFHAPKEIIPFLKESFPDATEGGQIRLLQIITHIDPLAESFLMELMQSSIKPDVKASIISLISPKPENIDFFKGFLESKYPLACKREAFAQLSKIEGAVTEEYLHSLTPSLLKKKTKIPPQILLQTTDPRISEALVNFPEQSKTISEMNRVQQGKHDFVAMCIGCNKPSEAWENVVCEYLKLPNYREMPKKTNDILNFLLYYISIENPDKNSGFMPKAYKSVQKKYHVLLDFMYDLRTESSVVVFEKYHGYLDNLKEINGKYIFALLCSIRHNPSIDKYHIQILKEFNPPQREDMYLKEPLHPNWYEKLLTTFSNMDSKLSNALTSEVLFYYHWRENSIQVADASCSLSVEAYLSPFISYNNILIFQLMSLMHLEYIEDIKKLSEILYPYQFPYVIQSLSHHPKEIGTPLKEHAQSIFKALEKEFEAITLQKQIEKITLCRNATIFY